MGSIAELLKQLSELYSTQLRCSVNGLSPAVWAEGGEWLSTGGAIFKERRVIREFDYKFVPVNTIDHAILEVERSNISYFVMKCGMGKSTILASRIASMKFTPVTFVVVPSFITAKQLAKYVTQTIRKASTLHVFNCDAGLYYVSAAQVLAWVIVGNDLSNITFIVDEAHCVTPVYRALKTWLTTVDSKVVFMTASVGIAVNTANIDCPVIPIGELTQLEKDKYSDHFANESALVVGVEDGRVAASPANLFIGNTFNVTLVLDTGLRLDPIYKDGSIEHGERIAQQTEIVQMTGRIGRGKARGLAVIVKNPRAETSAELRLYDFIYDLYLSMLGMSVHSEFIKALIDFNKLTGYETRETVVTDVVLSNDIHLATKTESVVELYSADGIKRLSLTTVMDQGHVVRTGDILRFTTPVKSVEIEISHEDIQNARLVLSERMVPEFSTIEYKTVTLLFQRMAQASNQRMSNMIVSQFVTYYRRFQTFHRTNGTPIEVDELFE